ncbi:hypothetical protein ACIO52_04595 [Nocardia sp. NPDC087230]|uniref:hypothetical protein n=1 Tax=Nocardia sp. NPDC087230 TaxID=3364331 RepID=UPI0037F356AC
MLMQDQSFECRYRSYTDLLTSSTPNATELDAIERQLGRLDHEVAQTGLDQERHVVLRELREEALGALGAAQHRSRIDDARMVADALCAGRKSVRPFDGDSSAPTLGT